MLSHYNVPGPLFPVRGGAASYGFGADDMMRRWFTDFERSFDRAPWGQRARSFRTPRAELRDTGDAVSMTVDLPGSCREDIDLSIEGTTVALKVAAPAASVPEGFTLVHRERDRGAVKWSFELPYPIDVGAVTATLQQGRLFVTLPKAPEAKPRSIPVQAV